MRSDFLEMASLRTDPLLEQRYMIVQLSHPTREKGEKETKTRLCRLKTQKLAQMVESIHAIVPTIPVQNSASLKQEWGPLNIIGRYP